MELCNRYRAINGLNVNALCLLCGGDDHACPMPIGGEVPGVEIYTLDFDAFLAGLLGIGQQPPMETIAEHTTEFEADLNPDTMSPRMRFNMANGWSLSIVLTDKCGSDGTHYHSAAVACCPTDQWAAVPNVAVNLGSELSVTEVIEAIGRTALRDKPS